MKRIFPYTLSLFLVCIGIFSCAQKSTNNTTTEEMNLSSEELNSLQTAVFGGGCFWCTEAIFQDLKGVKKVESGYANGHIKNPSYKEVCTGRTGHAEVIKIFYDENEISYAQLLEVHFRTHNPTTLNRQGNDVGTQYRSGVYFSSESEKSTAEKVKEAAKQLWDEPIVTEIEPLNSYYTAEDYHQNYYKNHQNEGYCSFVIGPKVEKFRKEFESLLKQ